MKKMSKSAYTSEFKAQAVKHAQAIGLSQAVREGRRILLARLADMLADQGWSGATRMMAALPDKSSIFA